MDLPARGRPVQSFHNIILRRHAGRNDGLQKTMPGVTLRLMETDIAAFDTHDFVKRLTGAGMPEAQAEILAREQARMVQERLATKQDIMELKREITMLEQRLTIKLGAMLVIGVTVLAALDKLL